MAVTVLTQEKLWFDKSSYDKAERLYFENLAKVTVHSIVDHDSHFSKCLISQVTHSQEAMLKSSSKKLKESKNKADKKNKYAKDMESDSDIKEQISKQGSRVSNSSDIPTSGSLAEEVAKARQHIKKGLQCLSNINNEAIIPPQDLSTRIVHLEKNNEGLRALVEQLNSNLAELKVTVQNLEIKVNLSCPASHIAVCPAKTSSTNVIAEDDVDLFGSDSENEDAEASRIRKERLEAYAAKKSKKPALIAKSNIILDVKPWDDETDMKAMEAGVRKITADGLLWGAAKLVPLAYKIHKLQISCVIEDDKVSVDWLTEQIEANEALVQSIDIAAFNKV